MPVTLVTGGVRSGKSRHAESLLAGHPDVTYVATHSRAAAQADDAQWLARVEAHQAARPRTWVTLETVDVTPLLGVPGGPLLVECLGTWLTGLVDHAGLWTDLDAAAVLVTGERARLVGALRTTAREVVVVSNEVGLSLVPLTAAGRFFQDELGRLTAAVADVADRVHLVVAGRVIDLSAAPHVGGPLP